MSEENNPQVTDPQDGQQGSQATDPQQSGSPSNPLERRVNNLETKSKNLQSLVDSYRAGSSAPASQASSASSAPSSQASSASSTNNGGLAQLQARMEAIEKRNSELEAQAQARQQQVDLANKAKNANVQLSQQDINFINGSQDRDSAFEYIKGLKAQAQPTPRVPKANIYKPNPNDNSNLGAQLAKQGTAGGLGSFANIYNKL